MGRDDEALRRLAASRGIGARSSGKRSDPAWASRTFFLQLSNDIALEQTILDLRAQGITVDKSELVDALIAAWVSYRRDGIPMESALGAFDPQTGASISPS